MRDTFPAPCLRAPRAMIAAVLLAVSCALGGCASGGAVISLSGPPDRDFARREGAGWLVGVAVWLMSRKVYAASAERGATYCWFFTEPNGEQLREIAGLVDRGAIKPVIDREFAFEQLPDALTYLEAGRARGKVVLRVK